MCKCGRQLQLHGAQLILQGLRTQGVGQVQRQRFDARQLGGVGLATFGGCSIKIFDHGHGLTVQLDFQPVALAGESHGFAVDVLLA